MRFLKFVAALAAAALLHFAGARLLPNFSLAVDLVLLVVALEARHGNPVAGMFAGLAAGLLADGLSGGPFGLYGFADTAVGFGIARAAQQLVVQRRAVRPARPGLLRVEQPVEPQVAAVAHPVPEVGVDTGFERALGHRRRAGNRGNAV